MQTMTLGEAAEFLKMSSEALRVKAKNKQITGTKLGKRWVFIQEDLEALLRGNTFWCRFTTPGGERHSPD